MTISKSPAQRWADELLAVVTTLESAGATLGRLETSLPPADGPGALAALLDLFGRLNVTRFHPDALSARGEALGAALRNALAVAPIRLERCLASAAKAAAALAKDGVQVEGLEIVVAADFGPDPLPRIGTGAGKLAVGHLDALVNPDHPLRAAVADPFSLNGRDSVILGASGATFYYVSAAAKLTADWVGSERRDREQREAERKKREAADLLQWEQANPQAALAARVRELETKLATAETPGA